MSCQIEVHQPGQQMGRPRAATPVRVGKAQGWYAGATRRSPHRVVWQDASGAWARTACNGADRARTLALAERVKVAPITAALPFRLTYLPKGYRAEAISFREGEGPWLEFRPESGFGDRPSLVAYTYTGVNQVPGREKVTINGRPAVMHAYHRVLCFTDPPLVCVAEHATDALGNSQFWPWGVRDLLIKTAAGLVGADIDDQSTWFEGREAFPH